MRKYGILQTGRRVRIIGTIIRKDCKVRMVVTQTVEEFLVAKLAKYYPFLFRAVYKTYMRQNVQVV